MLPLSDYIDMDAITLAQGVRNRDFTNTEVTACAIKQAEKLNPTLNAINIECYNSALEQARLFDDNPELLNQSCVAGLPFLIKDLAMVKGLPTTYGSQLYKDYLSPHSSNIVQKYLDAGLVILGKTNTPECGLTLTTEPIANGITRNPWKIDHSTGGSSGGAGAAVAGGISPVAHATDGGGSIRIPASCCGLFGLKPSRGLTTVENNLAASWGGLSAGHVVSQTVRDSAAFLDLITLDAQNLFARPNQRTSFLKGIDQPLTELRIGIQLSHPMDQHLDESCLIAVKNAALLCESLGHHPEEINHPVEYRPVVSAMTKVISAYLYKSLSSRLEELNLELEEAPLESSTRIMASFGRDLNATDYMDALDMIKAAEKQMITFHQRYDIVLSPVLSKTPVKIGWLDMDSDNQKEYTNRFREYSGFTALYNGTGQPSMSVPLHQTQAGLPIGVMFTGAWGMDLQLLQLAKQLEQAQPWPRIAQLAKE